MKNPNFLLEKRLFIAMIIAVIITGTLTVISLSRSTANSTNSILCTFINSYVQPAGIDDSEITPTQYTALLRYATSRLITQQTPAEITVTLDLLQSLGPCNFLIFGLGYDSLMWSSFNPRGNTVFLEDDIHWIHNIINEIPALRVHHVHYTTRLSEAHDLMRAYRYVKQCRPSHVTLRGNTLCKLALSNLPDEVYEKDWDVILIDGPMNFYVDSPGRMSAIFTAAVMARGRRRAGVTHVLVHDAHRKVDRMYAAEFLCSKYVVNAVQRLWHFAIPPSPPHAKFHTRFC